MTTSNPLDLVFPGLDATSPLLDLCIAATAAGRRAARADLARGSVPLDDDAQGAFEAWLTGYRADEVLVAGLTDRFRELVLTDGWAAYTAEVLSARGGACGMAVSVGGHACVRERGHVDDADGCVSQWSDMGKIGGAS